MLAVTPCFAYSFAMDLISPHEACLEILTALSVHACEVYNPAPIVINHARKASTRQPQSCMEVDIHDAMKVGFIVMDE